MEISTNHFERLVREGMRMELVRRLADARRAQEMTCVFLDELDTIAKPETGEPEYDTDGMVTIDLGEYRTLLRVQAIMGMIVTAYDAGRNAVEIESLFAPLLKGAK